MHILIENITSVVIKDYSLSYWKENNETYWCWKYAVLCSICDKDLNRTLKYTSKPFSPYQCLSTKLCQRNNASFEILLSFSLCSTTLALQNSMVCTWIWCRSTQELWQFNILKQSKIWQMMHIWVTPFYNITL